MVLHDLFGHGGAAVVAADLKAVVRHVQGQAAAHDGEADDSNVGFL